MLIGPHALLARICVSPPYYALREVSRASAGLVATAFPDAPTHLELGAMPAAELSRHAAIAGLCTAALHQNDDNRRYYLATRALYLGAANPCIERMTVQLHTRLHALDKREAHVFVSASAAGQPVATLDVVYTILGAPTFARLFRGKAQVTPTDVAVQAPLPEGTTTKGREGLRRSVAEVPVACCAGHFDGFPALPVAILMGELAAMCGKVVGQPFQVARAEVTATELVWAGSPVSFSVHRIADDGLRALFDCRVSSGSAEVATMHLTALRQGSTGPR